MTMRSLKVIAAAAVLAVAGSPALAADEVLLSEGFENLTTLFSASGGWRSFNFSVVPFSEGWFQGSADRFAAHAGGADSFVASAYFIQQTEPNGDPVGGVADGLLQTKVVSLERATRLDFWTRGVAGNVYPDSLYVGYTLGASAVLTDYLPLEINPNGNVGGYPEDWTKYSVTLPAQGAGKTGRFVFEYSIPDTLVAGNYVGLDSVTITAVPEPGTWLLMGLGVAALAGLARRRAT